METIHIARNGQPLGTFSEDQIREGIVNSQFTATDLYWIEGTTDWRPLSELASQWGVEIPLPPALPTLSIPSDGTEPAWERRKEIGFFPAIFQTITGVLLRPSATFANLKQTGGFGVPLRYSVIMTLIAQVFSIPYTLETYNINPAFTGLHKYLPESAFNLTIVAASILLTPLFCALGLFLFGGLFHFALILLDESKTPFETTFRINAYTNGSTIAFFYIPINIVAGLLSLVISPQFVSNLVLIPALAAFIWMLVCIAIGLQRVNNIGAWKATFAVTLPWIFCCCFSCAIGLIIPTMLMYGSHMGHFPHH